MRLLSGKVRMRLFLTQSIRSYLHLTHTPSPSSEGEGWGEGGSYELPPHPILLPSAVGRIRPLAKRGEGKCKQTTSAAITKFVEHP